MIQGETAVVRLTDIVIDRGDRVRAEMDPKAIEALAESISRLGLIHFPVVRRDMVLVSGENRIEAMRSLGWDRTTITWADTAEPDELLSLELEENIKRSDLTWQEQCDGVRRYHELQRRRDTEWTQERTAAGLGLSERATSEYLAVAAAIAKGDARVAEAPRFSTAKGIVGRARERAAADELNQVHLNFGDVESLPEPDSPILEADFNTWAREYRGEPFNFLHCDFPYGINAQAFNQTANAEHGDYVDDFATFAKLCETLAETRDRLLGTSAHCIFWFSMRHYSVTLDILRGIFAWVDPYPLLWHKSDNKGTLPDPQRGPRRVYEVAFLCSHGDRKIISPVSNVFSGPTESVVGHMSEKSQTMLQHFFRMVVDENTKALDPTCGSGSALRAAAMLGARSVLGLERDAEFVKNAQRAWRKEMMP